MERKTIETLLASFSGLKILVIGDLMLDRFIWGRVDRISPEAPVPVVEVERETDSLGGAGNVVTNLRSLDAGVIPIGVIGDDSAGAKIKQLMAEASPETGGVLTIPRATTVKARILAHQQQVVRVDREERGPVLPDVEQQLASKFLEALYGSDAVIISDYAKGTITPGLLHAVLPAAKQAGKPVFVDPKPRYFSSYKQVTVITPNQSEAGQVVGYPIQSEADLRSAAARILEMIQCEALLITRGEKGMALFSDGQATMIAARAKEVFDVTGAGDTVISVLSLALAAGASMQDAVFLTNVAAGLVVGKVGTASVTAKEILAALQ